MMKFLLILLILLVLLALIATRYRKQIIMGIEVWKAFKKMREGSRPPEKQVAQPRDRNAPLVKCIKCGTWIPQTNALMLGSSSYCSASCVEKSAASA